MRTLLQGGLVALAFAAAAVAAPASAATVHGTSVDMNLNTGRSLALSELEVDPTITPGPNGTPDATQIPAALTVNWDISQSLGIWSYKYTIDWEPTSASDISHLVLNLSAGCGTTDMLCVQNPKINTSNPGAISYGTFEAQSGNPNLDAKIFGVKFDVANNTGGDPFVLEFQSNRSPVWGDIYLKAGKWSANNVGLADPHESTSVFDFIARPNGAGPSNCPGGLTFCNPQETEVPEPASMALLGAGILGLGLLRRRSTKAA